MLEELYEFDYFFNNPPHTFHDGHEVTAWQLATDWTWIDDCLKAYVLPNGQAPWECAEAVPTAKVRMTRLIDTRKYPYPDWRNLRSSVRYLDPETKLVLRFDQAAWDNAHPKKDSKQ